MSGQGILRDTAARCAIVARMVAAEAGAGTAVEAAFVQRAGFVGCRTDAPGQAQVGLAAP